MTPLLPGVNGSSEVRMEDDGGYVGILRWAGEEMMVDRGKDNGGQVGAGVKDVGWAGGKDVQWTNRNN